MADPEWLGYTGAITGIIGAITGTIGSMLGYIAYRRSNQLKALDLRLELKKNLVSLDLDIKELIPHLEYAYQSKLAVAAARGLYQSSATQKWVSEYTQDKAHAEALIEKIPKGEQAYEGFSISELELKLVEAHSLKDALSRLHDKYQKSLDADEKNKDKIAAARNNLHKI